MLPCLLHLSQRSWEVVLSRLLWQSLKRFAVLKSSVEKDGMSSGEEQKMLQACKSTGAGGLPLHPHSSPQSQGAEGLSCRKGTCANSEQPRVHNVWLQCANPHLQS